MPPRPERSRWLRSWPTLVALFLIPAAAWAISNPLLAVPDEPSHVTKAVSIWYGQIEGRNTKPGTGLRTYRLPHLWNLGAPCYAFHWDVGPNSCGPVMSTDAHVTDVSSDSGAYPPLYFALVGWAGRLFPRARGLYLMRLASALFCAAFLAAAVKALQQAMSPGRAVAAVLVAVTPMTLFLAGSVNPSGFEICTGIALWAYLLAMARRAEVDVAHIPRNLLVGTFVSGTALAFTRPLSGPFAGVIVVLALLSVGWPTLAVMARRRAVVVTVVGLAAMCVIALGLAFASGLFTGVTNGTVIGGIPFPPGSDHWTVVMGATPTYLQEMIGLFGWLDTPASNFVLYVWLGMVFALMGASLLLTRLRQNLALALTVAATIAIPLVLQAPLGGSASLIWQGRYTLPVAAGVPLLAMMGIDRGAGQLAGGGRRLSIALAVTVGVVNTYALYWNLHRYTVGFTSRTINILHGAWQPPGGSLLWLMVMAGVAVLDTVVVVTAPTASPTDRSADRLPPGSLPREPRPPVPAPPVGTGVGSAVG